MGEDINPFEHKCPFCEFKNYAERMEDHVAEHIRLKLHQGCMMASRLQPGPDETDIIYTRLSALEALEYNDKGVKFCAEMRKKDMDHMTAPPPAGLGMRKVDSFDELLEMYLETKK